MKYVDGLTFEIEIIFEEHNFSEIICFVCAREILHLEIMVTENVKYNFNVHLMNKTVCLYCILLKQAIQKSAYYHIAEICGATTCAIYTRTHLDTRRIAHAAGTIH